MSAEDEDFLRRSLADLELERAAGDLSDEDYADLKARYERKLLGSGDASGAEVDRSRHQKRWGRTVVTVVIVAVVGIGAGLAMARFSGERDPGEEISGSTPTTMSDDLTLAAERFQAGDASGAVEIYQRLLDEDPNDVAALTYMGWTLRNVAIQQEDERLRDTGIGFLEHALEVDPTYSEAWFFRGIIYLRDENLPDKAVDALRLALANDPIPEIEGAARELLAEIAQSP